MDIFDIASVDMDAEVLSQDFDNVDLYGDILEENDTESDVQFE